MNGKTQGSSVPPRWSVGGQPVTPAQIARARQAPPGTHPAVVVAMPLAPPTVGQLKA